MRFDDRVRLPGQRSQQPPQPEQFPMNTRVLLANCPHAQPGTVTGTRRKKIAVHWSDLRLTTYHDPCSLVLAADAEPRAMSEAKAATEKPTQAADAAPVRENPHDRILRRIREANEKAAR